MVKNPGLLSNIASSYRSRFTAENLISPKLFENYVIQGKKRRHTVDIYLEFIQMNNREITIMKTIPSRNITEKDIWDFYTVLQDLKFKATGIIYYENGTTSQVLNEQASLCNIEIQKFDLLTAVAESVVAKLGILLPDRKAIGDPFWIIMEVSENNENGRTNGNYLHINGSIPLFLSKKHAKKICDQKNRLTNVKYRVFGLSQNQLKMLCEILLIQEPPIDLGIVFPEFEQPNGEQIAFYVIDLESIIKFYYREN